MNGSTGGLLGIKTSDGRIVEVLGFGTADERTTVFTTVADRQRRARFEFYFRSTAGGRWVYLDALWLEHLRPAEAGEPDLEVHARLDRQGNLLLGMQGAASAQPQVFVVQARTLQRFRSLAAGGGAALPPRTGGPASQVPAQEPPRKRGSKAAWIALVPVLLIGLLLLVFVGLRGGPGKRAAEPAAQAGPAEPEPAGGAPQPGGGGSGASRPQPSPPPAESPAEPGAAGIEAPAGDAEKPAGAVAAEAQQGQAAPPSLQAAPEPAGQAARPPLQAAPEPAQTPSPAPAAAPRSHEIYEIIWGDTLWRITERYYGDRDLYHELAERNDLLDPDYIIAGHSLQLPPVIGDRKRKSREGNGHE